jgi:hypothetical protein
MWAMSSRLKVKARLREINPSIHGMKCPSCSGLLPTPEPRCPTCGLTLQKLDVKFGLVPRHSRFLSDRSGKLEAGQLDELREQLRVFELKFPQVLFSVFVTDLPAGSSVQEYGFWLANRARFSSIQKSPGDNFDLLLVIDLSGNAASLTTSYGLEKYVSAEDLEDALAALAEGARDGRVPDGIRACIRFVTQRWRQRAEDAQHAAALDTLEEVAA